MFRSWRCGFWISIAAGLMVQWMPVVHWQLGIVQLVPLWAVVLTLMFLLRFARRPSLLTGLALGLSTATTYLLCSYYGLMLGVLVIATLPVLLHRRLFQLGHLRWVAVACLAAVLATGPVIWGQWQARGSLPIPRANWSRNCRPTRFTFSGLRGHSGFPCLESTLPIGRLPGPFRPGPPSSFWRHLEFGKASGENVAGSKRCSGWHSSLSVPHWRWGQPFRSSAMVRMTSWWRFAPDTLSFAISIGLRPSRSLLSWSWPDLASRMFGDSFLCAARSHVALGAGLRVAGGLAVIVALLESLPSVPGMFTSPAAAPAWVEQLAQRALPTDVIAVFPLPQDATLAQSRSACAGHVLADAPSASDAQWLFRACAP